MDKLYKKIYLVIGAYLLIVFIGRLTGLSSLSSPFDAVARLIPSIGMFSKEAHDIHKANFELCMGWLFSFGFAFFYPFKFDWVPLENRAISMGGKTKTGIKLISFSFILFFSLLYPHTPSVTGRYGSTFIALLKNDSAYVLGLAIMMVSFLAWFGMISGTYLLYKDRSNQKT